MADPQLRREGNLRLASMPSPGWPADPWATGALVRELLDDQDLEPHGSLLVWFSMPPGEDPPERWECQVGWAVTGMPHPDAGMLVEDYRQLNACVLAHPGPIRDLPATWRRIDAHVRTAGWRPRPYWRLALRDRRLADGNLLPEAEVALFVER
jgi:hypothetical protein